MQHALLGLIAETSLHAGAGKSVGVIDLPIMRESHTGWPCVFGSAVKGALRTRASQENLAWVADVFGPDTNNAGDHAGALAVGDARLLLMPVRSLTGHFKWVTCPSLLRRVAADATRLGIKDTATFTTNIGDDEAITPEQEGSLFLEEFHFKAKKQDMNDLLDWLASFVGADFKDRLAKQLVIVSDDIFAHMAQFATPVTPHIAINNERKIVKSGALWYEETLSPETVLYVTLAASASRRDAKAFNAEKILDSVLSLFSNDKPYLQLGGNETVGMGWCRVNQVNQAKE
jgi:CRISPR-associated protein Cmr4